MVPLQRLVYMLRFLLLVPLQRVVYMWKLPLMVPLQRLVQMSKFAEISWKFLIMVITYISCTLYYLIKKIYICTYIIRIKIANYLEIQYFQNNYRTFINNSCIFIVKTAKKYHEILTENLKYQRCLSWKLFAFYHYNIGIMIFPYKCL